MTDIKIPEEYMHFDYGFSGVEEVAIGSNTTPSTPYSATEDRYNEILAKLDALQTAPPEEVAKLKEDIRKLEAIIIPLLNNLLKTADKDYIYWPNRKELIEQQIQTVLGITRS